MLAARLGTTYIEQSALSSARPSYFVVRNEDTEWTLILIDRPLKGSEVDYLLLSDGLPWFDSDETEPTRIYE